MSAPHPSAPTRRQALRLAGGAALTTGAVALGGPAAAAGSPARAKYTPGRYPATPILTTSARHLANRFSYGITPALAAEVRAAGGHLAWFDRQLETAYDGSADNLVDWWPALHLGTAQLWAANIDGSVPGYRVNFYYGARSLARRIVSPRQVLEVVAEFWENHFHVPINADGLFAFRVPYGEAIRQRALGRFEDLLNAAVLDPAMLFYLGNASSTKAHPNENLGRELLELHTVGLGNYTEDDVKAAARILTGWRVDVYKTWDPYYSERDHWTGPVKVMGFTDANAAPDGRDVTRRFLSYLAHHPATATRVATKLARQFVSDDPPAALVERLAATYLAHDTAIVPVLRELVRSREFTGSVDRLVRDADEDVVAAYRLLGITLAPPKSDSSGVHQLYGQVSTLGLAPWSWPRPDGQPVTASFWSSPTRILASMSVHWSLAGGWWPNAEVTHRSYRSWLPTRSLPFRDLVDHASRLLLQRPSTATLLQACCEATELAPTLKIDAKSDLFTWRWPRLAAAILDSPAFYQR